MSCCTADPQPPTGVLVVAGIECGTAIMSWNPSMVSSNAAIGTYSVRYRPRSGGDYVAVNSTSTTVILQGLNHSLEYVVDVSAIDSCGSKSGFSMEATLDLQCMQINAQLVSCTLYVQFFCFRQLAVVSTVQTMFACYGVITINFWELKYGLEVKHLLFLQKSFIHHAPHT